MKHLAFFSLGLLLYASNHNLHAQTNITNDYVVIYTADVASATPYTDALDAADWETYRLQNQRYQLSFDNGFTVELKSAVELVNLGYPLNIPTYQTEYPVGHIPPTLKLLPGNFIGIEINTTPAKYH